MIPILAQDQPEGSLQRRLYGRNADLAVALSRMPVTAGKKRSFHKYREVEFCACYQFFVVEIAAMCPGLYRG